MKAITVWRPWPTMIVLGEKTIESRTHDKFKWIAGHQLAIHAGKRYDRESFEFLIEEAGYSPLRSLLIESACPRGAIVAVCHVPTAGWLHHKLAAWRLGWDYSREESCSPGELFGLFLEDVRALKEPVPARGSQGIWEWTPPVGWSVERDTIPVKKQEAREG